MAYKDNTVVWALGAVGLFGAVYLYNKSRQNINSMASAPMPGQGEENKGPLGIGSNEVKQVFSKVSGIPVVGEIASKQWEISPWSVVGGVAFGPLGTGVGFIKDKGGAILEAIKSPFTKHVTHVYGEDEKYDNKQYGRKIPGTNIRERNH